MRSLMMFFGSCGHTTVEEIHPDSWEKYAKNNRSRTGRKTRMVYVCPDRFCLCLDCFLEK